MDQVKLRGDSEIDKLTQICHQRNQQSLDAWELYAPHRDSVTLLLRKLATPTDRLCILGAGNCNDFDLKLLAPVFQQIDLVDLDSQAVSHALDRQGIKQLNNIRVLPSTDVSGWLAQSTNTPQFDMDSLILTLNEKQAPVDQVVQQLSGPYEIVASVGLLSQLIDSIQELVAPTHILWSIALKAIIAQHINLLSGLTSEGGKSVLFTELFSSDSCEELFETPDSALSRLCRRELDRGNHYKGLNPAELRALHSKNSGFRHVSTTMPWKWQYLSRTYAVCAHVATKHRKETPLEN
ncbi:MAG: hypothetical protein COA78_03465 [Blastopirellula sp.]|nr:MAG: hypothetical protein COA78_03465 [Blastopirellula sp.]